MIIFETERLIFRNITADDLDNLYKLSSDPDVMRYISQRPLTLDEVNAGLTRILKHYENHDFGLWATIYKPEGKFIGRCGLIVWDLEEVSGVEIGYALAKAYWGKGLATEAARAIRDYGFKHLDVSRLMSIIHDKNIASQRVAEHTGLHHESNFTFREMPCRLYAIERSRCPFDSSIR
jgi:ribosomal-protein-alanine N-acetyltransferase